MRARREEFVTAAMLIRQGFTAGELSSAMRDGSLPPPLLRDDGMAIFRTIEIEKLYDGG
jgi:hypothetical protein